MGTVNDELIAAVVGRMRDPKTPGYVVARLARTLDKALDRAAVESGIEPGVAITRSAPVAAAKREAPEGTEEGSPQPLGHAEPTRRPARRVNRVARRSIGGESAGDLGE